MNIFERVNSPVYSYQSLLSQTQQPVGCLPAHPQIRTWPSRLAESSFLLVICSNARKRAIRRTDLTPDHLQSQMNLPRDILHFQGKYLAPLNYFPPTWHVYLLIRMRAQVVSTPPATGPFSFYGKYKKKEQLKIMINEQNLSAQLLNC